MYLCTGQEYGNLVVRLRGAEGRLREMNENVVKLEASKGEYETRLAIVNSALQNSALHNSAVQYRSRGNTPTRNSRPRYRYSRGGVGRNLVTSLNFAAFTVFQKT